MTSVDPNPYASPSIAAEGTPTATGVVATIDFPLASRWRRFLGALIDAVIQLIIVLPLGAAIDAALVIAGVDMTSLEESFLPSLFGFVLGCGVFVLVNGYLLATSGQTVGKYWLSTQIVSDEGRLVPLWKLMALRYVPLWLISVIPGLGWIVSLADSLAIFRDSHKCFHDDIAGTKVIQLEAGTRP